LDFRIETTDKSIAERPAVLGVGAIQRFHEPFHAYKGDGT
jgi:hypothetical protein